MWPTEGSPTSAPPLTPRARRALLLGSAGVLCAVVLTGVIAIRTSGPRAPSYGVSGSGIARLWVGGAQKFEALPATAAGPRSNHTDMAFDRARGVLVAWDHGCARVVMGFQGGCIEQVDQTWTWDGQSWTARSPRSEPTSTGAGAMAYDAHLGAVVYANRAGSAWTWSGSTWQRLAGSAPSGAIAAGSDLDGRLLFVGSDSGGVDPADARQDNATLVADPAHGQLLYIGLHFTWSYAGGHWLHTTQPDFHSPAAAYDERARAVVLITEEGTTWTWSGTAWAQGAAAGPEFPANRSGAYPAPLVYDSAQGRLIALISAA